MCCDRYYTYCSHYTAHTCHYESLNVYLTWLNYVRMCGTLHILEYNNYTHITTPKCSNNFYNNKT